MADNARLIEEEIRTLLAPGSPLSSNEKRALRQHLRRSLELFNEVLDEMRRKRGR